MGRCGDGRSILLLLKKEIGELCKLAVGESRLEDNLSGNTSSLGLSEAADGVKVKVAFERRRRFLKNGIISFNGMKF